MKAAKLAGAIVILGLLFAWAVPPAFAYDYSHCGQSEEVCLGATCCGHARACCKQTNGSFDGDCSWATPGACSLGGCMGGTIYCEID